MPPTGRSEYYDKFRPQIQSGISPPPKEGAVLFNNCSTEQTTESPRANYDETGAMQFVVCTIIVYSVGGVCCTFVSRFRRYTSRSNSDVKAQDEAVNKYLKKEKRLKLEGYKMQMLNEIAKHSENIKCYEERMRLLELERQLQAEDFSAACAKGGKSKRKNKGFLKRNRKKQSVDLTGTGTFKQLANRRKSASDAFGKVGFSILFMDTANPRLQELQEEEEVDSAPECELSDFPLSRGKLKVQARIPDLKIGEEQEVEVEVESTDVNNQTETSDENHLMVKETSLSSSV